MPTTPENDAIVHHLSLISTPFSTVPGTAQVRGFADADAEVTVNGNGTWRSGEYFYGGDDADNAAFPVFQELAIEAASPEDDTTAVTGRVFVAQSPERFTYDGNMTSDGRFRYTWNAENRLVRAQELVAPTNRHPYTVAYAYDHRGRMVSKRITENDGQDSLVKSTSYLWDGWNIIREIQGSGVRDQGSGENLVTDNVWGLDLDGTLQGAGGVGGLLAVIRSNSNSNSNSNSSLYFPTYDANGNISEYVSTNGEIVAHYDYSPFGETLIETGDLASTFTHRFSTKPWCPVTGLYEYQMRKYRPEIGRWLSRDPIGEKGGMNLLLFCANSPTCHYDVKGQITPINIAISAVIGGIMGGISAALTDGDVAAGIVGGIVSGGCVALAPHAVATCSAIGGAVSGFISGAKEATKNGYCGIKWFARIGVSMSISTATGYVFGGISDSMGKAFGTWTRTIQRTSFNIEISIQRGDFISGIAAGFSSTAPELVLVTLPEAMNGAILRLGEQIDEKYEFIDIQSEIEGVSK